jgi:hypothetical protein
MYSIYGKNMNKITCFYTNVVNSEVTILPFK